MRVLVSGSPRQLATIAEASRRVAADSALLDEGVVGLTGI